jgi:hypothetical protein
MYEAYPAACKTRNPMRRLMDFAVATTIDPAVKIPIEVM